MKVVQTDNSYAVIFFFSFFFFRKSPKVCLFRLKFIFCGLILIMLKFTFSHFDFDFFQVRFISFVKRKANSAIE